MQIDFLWSAVMFHISQAAGRGWKEANVILTSVFGGTEMSSLCGNNIERKFDNGLGIDKELPKVKMVNMVNVLSI
jgi:hypothetical protein